MSKIQKNKVTSKLSENEKQQLYKNARAKDWYEKIWTTVGKCVFCDLKDKYIIYEENGIALTINLYPYIDGQIMAVPRRHVNSPKQLSDLEWETIRKFSYLAKKLIRKVYGHKGLWHLIREGGNEAQMSVTDHLHMQFIPFDKSDLSKWNYRELQYTPLENVKLYKDNIKEFLKLNDKFQKKYSTKSMLPIVCDLIIINPENKVLFQERKEKYKFEPDILTLPGGHIDVDHKTLQEELSREVREEIGIEFDPKKFMLIDSQIGNLNQNQFSKHLKSNVNKKMTFLWNTYVIKIADLKSEIVPGDDCQDILWLEKSQIEKNNRITKELKERIFKVLK